MFLFVVFVPLCNKGFGKLKMAESKTKASTLPEQRLEDLKIDQLDPYDLHVMCRQATLNIGTIGHVAHGKSTVVKAISGVQVRFQMAMAI